MRGYTRDQLDESGFNVENYVLCDNCELYWHKRTFKKHLRPADGMRRITIVSPAWDDFIKFVAVAAVRQWQAAVADGTYEPSRDTKKRKRERKASPREEILTVDEAVERYGLSREMIMAELKRRAETFEFEIPATATRSRK